MISPEMLRFYPFFGTFDSEQLKEVAMISEEIALEKAATLFTKGQSTDGMFVLVEGGVDLFDVITSEHDPYYRKEYLVSEMETGAIMGVTALVEPYTPNSSARSTTPCRLIKINAAELRALADKDTRFGYILMQQVVKLVLAQLETTRGMLDAAMIS